MAFDKKNYKFLYFLIISLFFNFIFIRNSYSLPQWKQDYAKKWIKNHKFLSPEILYGDGCFFAKKELKDHFFINVCFTEGFNSIYSVTLSLDKKKWNNENKDWDKIKSIDIWNRGNKKAIELIKNIYDQKIASDFKNSVNIYNGNEYVLSRATEYYREKIEDNLNFSEYKKKLPNYMQNDKLIYLEGNSVFYKGKLFAYEFKKENKDGEISLKIFPLKDLNHDINILKNNEKIFKKYLNYINVKEKKSKNTSQSMIYVEGGSFMMGNNDFEEAKPVHNVTLNYNFEIDKYEVTQKELNYLSKMYPDDYIYTNSTLLGDNLPANSVTFETALKFCNAKSKLAGFPITYDILNRRLLDRNGDFTDDVTKVVGYRLPTEEEWEFAARGGNKTRGYKYSGSNNLDDVAVYNESNKTGFKSIDNPIPMGLKSVGSKKANELGIYDMTGNVWEWCQNYFTKNYSNDSIHTSSESYRPSRVMRGGSSYNFDDVLDISYRIGVMDYYGAGIYSGFRVVRTL